VLEGPFDAVCEVDQKREGIGWPIVSQKCSGPALDMAIRVDRLTFNEAGQVRHLFRAVDERISSGEVLDIEVVNVCVRMIKTNGAVEPKLLGTARKRAMSTWLSNASRARRMFVVSGNQKSASIKL